MSLRWAIVGIGLGVLIAAGCQETRKTVGYYRPIPPKPRPLPPAPPGAKANALVLNVSAAPLDTNGNGYPDLIHTTTHLFDTRYPPAIHQDGAFVFLLYAPGDAGRPDAGPIRQWEIGDEKLAHHRSRSAFGDCYRFRLSLLDGGTDALPITMADMVCRFEPADGSDPTYAGEVASIQVGRRVLVPQFEWQEPEDSASEIGAWP